MIWNPNTDSNPDYSVSLGNSLNSCKSPFLICHLGIKIGPIVYFFIHSRQIHWEYTSESHWICWDQDYWRKNWNVHENFMLSEKRCASTSSQFLQRWMLFSTLALEIQIVKISPSISLQKLQLIVMAYLILWKWFLLKFSPTLQVIVWFVIQILFS